MDKVAVVIPNYNGYRYLETCFAALAKQTFTEFTTYFVDNGSQDELCVSAGTLPGDENHPAR